MTNKWWYSHNQWMAKLGWGSGLGTLNLSLCSTYCLLPTELLGLRLGLACSEALWWASQVAPVVKNLPANAADAREMGLIPGSGRSLGGGHDNPLQYLCMEYPMDRGDWRATVHRPTKSWTQLKQLNTRRALTKWLSSAIATEERQVISRNPGNSSPSRLGSQLCYGCKQGGSKLAQNPTVTLVPRKGVTWNQLRSQPSKPQ